MKIWNIIMILFFGWEEERKWKMKNEKAKIKITFKK